MGLFFESFCTDLLAISISIAIGIFTYFKWVFTYWKKRNLPYIEPVFPRGNAENPLAPKTSPGFWAKGIYEQLKSQGHKHGGVYNFAFPTYLLIDPEYVKNVMQRDFQHFVDRGMYHNEKADPLSAHLFAIGGQKWRHLRTKLTPTFTSGKMKMMFDTLVACSKPMEETMHELTRNGEPVEIKEIVACFTTDIIGSCAFGLDCNSFKSEDAEFRKYGRKIFKRTFVEQLRFNFLLTAPHIGKMLGMRLMSKDVSNFFFNAIKDTVSYREKNNFVRKDMLQLLVDLKGNDKSLSIEEIAAQAFVFFLAGFETSSTTMTFCLFELARNPEIQQKVRDEINEVLKKHDNQITYEALMEMKYMSQVIDETLRKYPPVTLITRQCVMDYKVPDTDVTIEKGTSVFIPVLGLHLDPEYYPDPEKFDPERFSEENKKQRHPFTYIPFGEGPRICIGLRFGVMQTKVGLTVLLKNFKFSVSKQTKLPFRVDPSLVIYSTKDPILLDTESVC